MTTNTERISVRHENERRLRGAARVAREAIESEDYATRKAGRLVRILVNGAFKGESRMLTLETGEVGRHLRDLGHDDAYSRDARAVFRAAADAAMGR